MSVFDTVDQGLQDFGIDPGAFARRLAQRQNPQGMPPAAGGAPERAGATPPTFPAPAGRMAAPPGAPQAAASAGPGQTAPPPSASPGNGGGMFTMPTPEPATKALADWSAANPPPAIQPLHGWKNVLDTIGKVVAPEEEAAIRNEPVKRWQTQLGNYESAAKAEEAAAGEGLTQAKTAQDIRKANEPDKPPTRENIDQEKAAAVEDLVAGGMSRADAVSKVERDTAKPTETRYEPRTIQDPSSKEPKPLDVLFDPVKGEFVDPATKQPITGARAYEKPDKTPQGSFTPIFDPKSGALTGFYDPTSGATRPPPTGGGTTSQGLTNEQKISEQQVKQNEPFQAVLDKQDEAKQFAEQHTGPGDIGLILAMVEATRPKAGFRMTQTEWNMIQHARSTFGDVDALVKKVETGQLLTDTQRQQMLSVIDIAAQMARKRLTAPASGPGGAAQQGGPAKGGSKVLREGVDF